MRQRHQGHRQTACLASCESNIDELTTGEEMIGGLERRFVLWIQTFTKIPTYSTASGSAKAKNTIIIHAIKSQIRCVEQNELSDCNSESDLIP